MSDHGARVWLCRRFSLLLVLSSLTGCHGPTPPGDGGSSGADSSGADSSDAGSSDAGDPLVVTAVTQYYNRKGIEFRSRDFAAQPAELIANEGGTPVTLQGTVMGPGRMRFDVPPGTYLLKSSDSNYIATSGRLVDLGSKTFGRPERWDNPLETSSIDFFLNLTGLQPAHTYDSPEASTLSFSSLDLPVAIDFYGPQLSAGATSVFGEDDSGYFPYYDSFPRFDATQGDTAWVLQSDGHDAGSPTDASEPWVASSIVAATHLDPFSFDGGTLLLKAQLAPVPQQLVHFEWHREEFDALRSASASSDKNSTFVQIDATLRDAQDGWIDECPSPLAYFQPTSNTPQTLVVRDLPYGNPYPMGWEPVAEFYNSYRFTQSTYDGSKSVSDYEWFDTYLPVSSLASQPAVRPILSMPRGLNVDGVPAFPSRRLETTTPQVTWEPPELGTPSAYVLQVRLLRPLIGSSSLTLSSVAILQMGPENHSVVIPPGILKAGNTYNLRLKAIHSEPVGPGQLATQLFPLPFAQAATVSGLLTVP